MEYVGEGSTTRSLFTAITTKTLTTATHYPWSKLLRTTSRGTVGIVRVPPAADEPPPPPLSAAAATGIAMQFAPAVGRLRKLVNSSALLPGFRGADGAASPRPQDGRP